ncbi:MAG: exodeoxyribonuclease VII small subunit [Desulfobacterales bacterium C00003106]|jgi:exodeoxyribonuclease VII small subunit|nr:MAG: exodeoxyribonuclease VII small subunit [Desulfobacterales bacterium C00003106]
MPKQNFENAMKRLEDIVRELESGEVSLEDSLKRFEEGIKLSRLCSKKLDAIEKKISILLQDEEKEVDEDTLES